MLPFERQPRLAVGRNDPELQITSSDWLKDGLVAPPPDLTLIRFK